MLLNEHFHVKIKSIFVVGIQIFKLDEMSDVIYEATTSKQKISKKYEYVTISTHLDLGC